MSPNRLHKKIKTPLNKILNKTRHFKNVEKFALYEANRPNTGLKAKCGLNGNLPLSENSLIRRTPRGNQRITTPNKPQPFNTETRDENKHLTEKYSTTFVFGSYNFQ
jgi:hypothetical protein